MVKLLLLAGTLFFTTVAFSQFTDSTHYFFNYAATGIINKTNNSNSYVFSNGLRFSARRKSMSLNNSNSWVYGWQAHNRTNNDFSSSLDFNLYKTFPHFYYWGLATYDKSYSLKINNRVQAGLGIAYNIIDRETVYLNLSDGIVYEAGSLIINDSLKNDYHTFRNSLRLRHRFALNNLLVLDGTYFWQPSLQDKHDYVFKFNTTLSVKLRKWLSVTAAATYNNVNRTKSQNLLMTFGLTAERYF